MRRAILTTAACAALLVTGGADAQSAQPIYGGYLIPPCAWPTTVSLGGCTGTLVHPEIVVYAAHCGQAGSARFGDNHHFPAFEVPTAGCQTHPGYWGEGSGRDIAFCRLSRPVTEVPIVPILMGCEVDALQPGRNVVAVGFGESNDGRGDGPKRAVDMPFGYIAGEEAFVGGGGKDTCFGDSGGPLYVQMDDGSWRVFGITSYGGATCGGGGFYSMMHRGIDWIEAASGVDVTPCHDRGVWAPGPGCGNFPLDPGLGGSSWAAGCSTGNVSGMSAMCGGPFANPEPPPPEPPPVEPPPPEPPPVTPPPTNPAPTAPPPEIPQPETPPTFDCSAPDCVSQCYCATGNEASCEVACVNAGTMVPPTSGFGERSSDSAGGCQMSSAGTAGFGGLWAFVAAALVFARRRRITA